MVKETVIFERTFFRQDEADGWINTMINSATKSGYTCLKSSLAGGTGTILASVTFEFIEEDNDDGLQGDLWEGT